MLGCHAAREADATYPEGNANLTIFSFAGEGQHWIEIEHMGPLRDIGPGEAAELKLTLTLSTLEASETQPDDLRRALLDSTRFSADTSNHD